MHESFDARDKGLGSKLITFSTEFLVSQKMSAMRPTLYTEITVYCSKDVNTHPLCSAER